MNKTNGFRDQASASTSLYSREHHSYKQQPTSSAFPTFLRWFKKNDRDQQKPRKILNGEVSDTHNTSSPSSSPTLGNLTPSSSCDSVISTSTTGFAYIRPQNYKPYKDAETPRIYIAQSPETDSYRRRIKKYNNSSLQNSPGISLKEKYFLYEADTLKSADICEGVYDNLEFYDRSLPNVKNSTRIDDKNTITRRRNHRRTVSDSSKDKKSGAYVHVKGKRKAPPPPAYVNGIALKNVEFYEDIENTSNNRYYDTLSSRSTLNRKKRRAPSPPSSPRSPTQDSVLSEGLLDDKEIKAIVAGITCNNRDSVNLEPVAMPSHYSKNSSENLTNSLKRGSLKSNKSAKSRFPPMIINTNVDSKLENIEADVKLVPPISPISPRPWYKRPISVNRESAIPFKREVVLKTMEKRKSKQKEKDNHLPEVGYSRSSIFDTANKFGFFMRTKDCQNDKSNNKEKRRSGIGMPNISQLDREAAEIVNKEHASQRAKIQAEREKFFNPPEHLILQQQMFGFKNNNCDDKQESDETDPVSTKDLISKFEASSNIARITINTTFIGPTDYFSDKNTEKTKIQNDAVKVNENTGKIINEKTETEEFKSEAIYSDTATDALSKEAAPPDDEQKLTGNGKSTKEASETADNKEPETNLVTQMSWSCPYCTLENPSWRIICEVCEKLKPFDILSKLSVAAAELDTKVEHKPPKNAEQALKTSNPSLDAINFIGKPANKNENKKAEQSDEWEKKTEKVLKYFMPRNTTNALSKSSSESTVGKKPKIFRKSPSPSKLPTSSPNISQKTRLQEQQKLSNKTLINDKDDNLSTADKKKPLLDSSVIVTTVTPVFYASTTIAKDSEQNEDLSNVIDLKEVRNARLAKFQPNLLTEANAPPKDAGKISDAIKISQKISDDGVMPSQPAENENLLNDHDTLEREKKRLREKIRAMNAKALAEKYPLQKSLSLEEKTKSNENLNNNDSKPQEMGKLGAIKKVFAKNRCSEYFGNSVAPKQDETEVAAVPPPRPKKVSTSVQTSGLVKRTVSPDGSQKSKSENDLLEANTDVSKQEDKTIYANVAKYENLCFNKGKTNSEQYEKIPAPDKIQLHEITAQLQSQEGINDFKATLRNPLRSISKTDTIALSKIMRNLELAIAEGQHELAAGIAMDLAKMKVSLQVTKITNRPVSTDIQDLSQTIIVDLYVKDEVSQKGPIQMTVKPLMTILELKEKASKDFEIPVRLQKWLINNEPAAENDKTLLECGLKNTKSVFYLHLLTPGDKVCAEKQINDLGITNLLNKDTPDKEENLSDISSDSYNDLYNEEYLEGATALPVAKSNDKAKIVAVKEKSPTTQANETKPDEKENPQAKESLETPWECPLCTLINNYSNLTCQACSKAKPLYNNLKQNIGRNLFSDELKHFLEFDKTLERPEANKNDLNKTSPNRKSSEIFNIIETKPKVITSAEPAKVMSNYSSPNITKNKYRGVDNYNPNRKISYERPATKNISPRKEKGRAPPPPNTTTNHYLELLKLDHSEAVPNTESFECPVCFMKCQSGEGVVLRDCLHVFCKECISNTVQFSEEAEVKCPYMDAEYSCDSVLQDREVKAVVSKEIYEKHLAKSVRVAEYQIENTFHCKTPNCRGWCIYEDNVNQFKCPVCRITNCLTCRVIHDGLTCKQYQDRLSSDSDSNVDAKRTKEMLAEMVEKGEAMNCPTCQVIMMKKWGCDWLKCSMCKTEVCWVTRGPRWGPGGKGDTTGGCKCGVDGKKCHPKCNYCH